MATGDGKIDNYAEFWEFYVQEHSNPLTRWFHFVGTTIGGYAFWYLGELCGLEFVGCFVLSSIGSLAGVFAGWKVAQHYS